MADGIRFKVLMNVHNGQDPPDGRFQHHHPAISHQRRRRHHHPARDVPHLVRLCHPQATDFDGIERRQQGPVPAAASGARRRQHPAGGFSGGGRTAWRAHTIQLSLRLQHRYDLRGGALTNAARAGADNGQRSAEERRRRRTPLRLPCRSRSRVNFIRRRN